MVRASSLFWRVQVPLDKREGDVKRHFSVAML
jgi:hypothetical protein